VGKAAAEKGYFVIVSITVLRVSSVVSLKATYKRLMNIEFSDIFAGVPVN